MLKTIHIHLIFYCQIAFSTKIYEKIHNIEPKIVTEFDNVTQSITKPSISKSKGYQSNKQKKAKYIKVYQVYIRQTIS